MNQMQTGIEAGGAFDRLLATGRNLWLAGLGVVAGVEESGRELFGQLVEKGRPVEEKQRQRVEQVTGRAQKTVRGLGQLVEDTVAYESLEVLKKLNVMTREDVKILSARLETLSNKLDEYAARRRNAEAEILELVTPQNEIAAVVVKTPKPRARTAKATTTKTTTTKTARTKKAAR
jgi:poly(hydroxyalkanoate) granule-associated protein